MTVGQATLAGRELAIAAGRRALLRGERVDMRALARELQIARATLYRWCGDRDGLLGDVLWSLSRDTLDQAAVHAPGSGREHFLATFERFMTALVDAQPFRRFIIAEPETASRVLMSKRGTVQERTVEAVAERLRIDGVGPVDPTLPLDTLAYVLVRIGESFVYADVLADAEPDVATAMTVIAALVC